MKMEREQIFIFSIFHRLLLRHLKYKVLKEARKSCQKKMHMKVKHSSNITQQYEKSGKFPGWGMTRWRNPCGVHAHGEHHPLLSTQDGPFASKHPVLINTIWYISHQNHIKHRAPGGLSANTMWNFPSVFTASFLLCYFPEGFLFFQSMKGESDMCLYLFRCLPI